MATIRLQFSAKSLYARVYELQANDLKEKKKEKLTVLFVKKIGVPKGQNLKPFGEALHSVLKPFK